MLRSCSNQKSGKIENFCSRPSSSHLIAKILLTVAYDCRKKARLETLRSRFFGISREPQEVTWPVRWREVCSLRFTFVRLDHVLAVSDLPQGFSHPKTSQSHVWEEILLFKTISLFSYRILFHRNLILKTISQLKQKWTNEWKQTWQPNKGRRLMWNR